MTAQADRSSLRNFPALEELQGHPQWVCWRQEERQGKRTKVPYSPTTGRRAESDNPATWATYEHACRAYKRSLQTKRPYHGMGFMFHRDYTGVDLDHCVNEDGSIDSWAQAYLDRLPSYAEYSPSQTGVHILVRATVPSGVRRRVPDAPRPDAAIELYCERRYFTVTGHHLPRTPTALEACPDLQAIYAELTAPRPRQQRAAGEDPGGLDDSALLEAAMEAKNGATFRALWHGHTSGYTSQSEAELALCNLLAFWTGKDASRMDHLFRCSALYRREKWDRPARSGETYGQGTIARAISTCTETYSPQQERKVIQFRRKGTAPGDLHEVELPATNLQFILDCLRDEEEGDARLYAHLFRGQCIYDHTERMWYEWRGNSWERDECKHALLLASNHLASAYLDASARLSEEAAEAEKRLDPGVLMDSRSDDPLLKRYQWLKAMTGALIGRARVLKKLQRVQAILTYAQAYLKITAREWDTNPWLLACQSGVLDLRTGELHAGCPEDYIRTAIPTAWTGIDTPCPRFERFLDELFADKPEQERADLIAFLQRLLGYSITGSTAHHLFAILYGEEGRNGKDTLLETIKSVLGPLVGVVSNDVFVAQDKFRAGGAPTPHLVDLQGKRLVWGSETRQGDKLNIAQIKLLTGGGEISARQLHGRQYSFSPTHKLLLMTNYKPHADARDKAFWSRACLLEFGVRFVDAPKAPNERKADPDLKAKLRQETSGILAWLVRGCLAWQQLGLAIPPSVQVATEQYRDEEDKILQFLTACCLVHPDAHVKASILYEAYKTWCKENQFGSGVNATLFGNEVSRRFEKKTTRIGRVYQGIGLLAAAEVGEGLVKGTAVHQITLERPSEARGDDLEQKTGEGCEGLRQVFLDSENDPLHKGKNIEKPFTPFTNSSIVNTSEPAPEADARRSQAMTQPFTNPSPAQSLAPSGYLPVRCVQVVEEDDGVKPHPSCINQLVDTPGGLGYLTGNRRGQDVTFTAPERKKWLRYTFGVRLLQDGVERFYLPRTVWEVQPRATQADEQAPKEGSA